VRLAEEHCNGSCLSLFMWVTQVLGYSAAVRPEPVVIQQKTKHWKFMVYSLILKMKLILNTKK